MGSATWIILMGWYTMVSNRHSCVWPMWPYRVCSLPLYKYSPCGHRIFMSILQQLWPMWPCKRLVQFHIPVAALVVIQDAQILMPIVAHVATWELRENSCTYCDLCDHTPTTVGYMGLASWAVRMRWYNMASTCPTVRLIWPMAIQESAFSLCTHCSPCGHRRLDGHMGHNRSR